MMCKKETFLEQTALRFVKQNLGAVGQTSEDVEALQQEVIDLRQRCARLAEENEELKAKVCFIVYFK